MADVRRFKTLLAIAELGTFAEAANSVHLTPAAVSQQMKALEEELGVALFDRTKRPPELSPMGYALVPKARELVRAYEELVPSLLGEMTSVENLTIGAVPTTITGLMPKALKALQDSYEKLHIRLYPGLSEELYTQVDRGFLDAAVMTEPGNIYDHLHWRPFAEEPLMVLASLDIASSDPIELLQNNPYIRFSRRAWVGRFIDTWLRDNQIQVHEGTELDSLEAISAMVLHNLGVSIVPMRCSDSPRPLPLKRIPLPSSAKPRVLGVLSRRDSSRSNLVKIFHEEVVRIVVSEGRVRVIQEPDA